MNNEKVAENTEQQENQEQGAAAEQVTSDINQGIEPPHTNDPIEKLEEDLTEQKNNYLRLYAEFDNYKKRTVKERIDLFKSAGADMITALLPVLDDFERALKATDGLEEKHPVREGMVLIYNKLKSLLEQKGLKAMDCKGAEFDTELHDAITSIEAGPKLKDKVAEEIEKGYYLNDKVIRHAKVIVGS